jgi:GNAT superfamily N-acetyltransferase
MQFALELFPSVLEEIKPLAHAAWAAASEDAALFPFEPNWPSYLRLDEAGALRTFVARQDGRAVGYAGYFVFTSLHAQRTVTAMSDAIWLDPAHRVFCAANRLLTFVENTLRAEGVDVIHTSVHAAFPALGRLLMSRGHKRVAEVYSKGLRVHA